MIFKRRTTFFLTGGLGNQLFQYAAALSRDPQNFYVEWQLGNPRVNKNLEPDLLDFNLPLTPYKYKGKFPEFFFSKTAGYLLRQGMQPTKIEQNWIFRLLIRFSGRTILSLWLLHPIKLLQATDNGYWKMPSRKKSEFLIGYFQSYIWASKDRILSQLRALELAQPSQELETFLHTESMFQVTAVHVRLGDYKLEDGFGIPEPEYYAEALKALSRKEPIKRIWLFSNEPEEALEFLPIEFRELTRIVPDFQGNAAVTLEAMRHAHRYVIANSSLSWWGAFLSYSESADVIAPSPWFKNSQEPRELVPPHWNRQAAWPSRSSD